MKKLLPLLAMFAIVMTACGTSEQEKQAVQEEANDKVNEIIQKLEASAPKEEPAKAAETDSTANDSTTMEDAHDHDGHDHGDHEGHDH